MEILLSIPFRVDHQSCYKGTFPQAGPPVVPAAAKKCLAAAKKCLAAAKKCLAAAKKCLAAAKKCLAFVSDSQMLDIPFKATDALHFSQTYKRLGFHSV